MVLVRLQQLNYLKKIQKYCLPIEIKALQTSFLQKLKMYLQTLESSQYIVIFQTKILLKNVRMKLMIYAQALMSSLTMLVW